MRHGSVEFIGMSIEEFSVARPGVLEAAKRGISGCKGRESLPGKMDTLLVWGKRFKLSERFFADVHCANQTVVLADVPGGPSFEGRVIRKFPESQFDVFSDSHRDFIKSSYRLVQAICR